VKQQYFGPSQRFGIYGLSMGLPLFNGAARARIRAGELAGEVNRLEAEQSLRLTEGRLLELTAQLQKDTRLIAYHRQTGLAQAETIIQTAARSLSAGEISYIDWTVLMNQAIQIRSSYLDALQSMRKTITDIIHLTGKP
jgi:cobalt-zinc-cadmium resistance protein CzcA